MDLLTTKQLESTDINLTSYNLVGANSSFYETISKMMGLGTQRIESSSYTEFRIEYIVAVSIGLHLY